MTRVETTTEKKIVTSITININLPTPSPDIYRVVDGVSTPPPLHRWIRRLSPTTSFYLGVSVTDGSGVDKEYHPLLKVS